jgi:LysM repeat protein
MKRLIAAIVLAVVALSFAAPVLAWGGTMHVVGWGETLSSIGRWYGVSPWAIAQANGLANPNYVQWGQRLIIPTGYYPAPVPGYGWYRVRYGDTLYRIAWRYGVDLWSLARANGIYNLNRIYAGQVLRIP